MCGPHYHIIVGEDYQPWSEVCVIRNNVQLLCQLLRFNTLTDDSTDLSVWLMLLEIGITASIDLNVS